MTFAIRVIICDGCGCIIDRNPPKGDACGGFTNKRLDNDY